MLKKITKTYQSDQKMSLSESYFLSDTLSQKHKNNSFLKVPVLFVGFNPMIHESDSVRSPTSPLDFRIFSSFGSPCRNPRSQNSEGRQKSWDCSKVGLSILDSSANENRRFESGKITQFSDSKNILMGRQMRASGSNFGSEAISLELPKSLPANFAVCPGTQSKARGQNSISDVVFEIGESQVEDSRASSLEKPRKLVPSESKSVDGSLQSSFPSGTSHICPIPASEIQQSEDYTCVTTHGPNPKVTHIFGDCIFDCLGDGLSCVIFSYPSEDFLKFCHSCRKKLDGEDIYMYRGEQAFCSTYCRSESIESDPEMVETEIWYERNNSLPMDSYPRIT